MFVNENFIPFDDQWAYLLEVKKVSENFVDEIFTLHGLSSELGELSTTSESKPWEVPVPQIITNEDFPQEVVCVKSGFFVAFGGKFRKVISETTDI